MKSCSNENAVRVEPFGVVGEAIATARSEWKTYLAWLAAPLAIWIGLLLLPVDLQTLGKGNWTLLAGGGALLILQAMLLTVFNIRVYRRVILGAGPEANMARQMFTSRTWNYIGNGFVMAMKWGVISLLFVLVPLVLAFRFSDPLIDALGSQEKLNILGSIVGELGSFAAFMVIAEQWILIFPEVSVDGPAVFSRLDRYAGHARWGIIKTMVLVWCVPYACATAIQLAKVFDWNVVWTGHPSATALAHTIDLLGGLLATFTGAVLYKKLSADWPARDAEYERTVREIKETPLVIR